jgi:ribonucleoside-diphosphate reductase alpha chain
LPEDIVGQIARKGIRNSHLTAIAPTGTISLLAGNISGGMEPVFEFMLTRRILDRQGHYQAFDLEDYAHRLWRTRVDSVQGLPGQFVTTRSLSPRSQLLMQSVLQPFVDNAISKTITVPHNYPFDAFQDLYRFAWRLGLKGCTTFRPGLKRGAVLSPRTNMDQAADKCCFTPS